MNPQTDKSDQILLVIVLISFICSLPFTLVMWRADWEKVDNVELLERRNPAGYRNWLKETNNCDYSSESYRDPEMDDFINPMHTVSFFLGIPFYLTLFNIFYFSFLLVKLYLWIPKLLRLILWTILIQMVCLKILKACIWAKRELVRRHINSRER